MIRLSLRDLQWRRRRFMIVVLVAALAFGLGTRDDRRDSTSCSQEGPNTVEFSGPTSGSSPTASVGPFTSSQLIDADLADRIATFPGVIAASAIIIGRTTVGELDVNIVGYDPDSPMLPDKLAQAIASTDGVEHGAVADITFALARWVTRSSSAGPRSRSRRWSRTRRSSSARPPSSFRCRTSNTCSSPARTSSRP